MNNSFVSMDISSKHFPWFKGNHIWDVGNFNKGPLEWVSEGLGSQKTLDMWWSNILTYWSMLVISGRGGIFYRTRFDPTMVSFSFERCWFFKLNPSTFDFDTRDHWAIRKSPQVQLMLTSTMWPSLKSPWIQTIKPYNHVIYFLGTEKGQTTKKFRRNHQPLQNIRSHIAVMAVCYRSLNQMSATIKLLRYPKTLEGAVVRHFAVNYIILGSKSHPFHITAGMKIPSPSTSNLRHHLGSQLPPKTQQKTLHPYTTFKHSASANSICLG